ncbi:MAG: beta-ketoacyl synthase N-terminal-like domain-containing protein [Eubacteriales bacterium]|nr:beta-ketoacyl synthase N-terminal-like domain-containing protein [Eubacteriales bacterium]
MPATVTTFRQYGAFNAEETDAQLELYLTAAKEALERAGVPERQQSALYDLTAYRLGVIYHDNPGAGDPGAEEIPLGLRSAVQQLKYAAPEGVAE